MDQYIHAATRHVPWNKGQITEQTREALLAWIRIANRRSDDYLFPSRLHGSPHLSTRQYARIVGGWVREIGLDSSASSVIVIGTTGGPSSAQFMLASCRALPRIMRRKFGGIDLLSLSARC